MLLSPRDSSPSSGCGGVCCSNCKACSFSAASCRTRRRLFLTSLSAQFEREAGISIPQFRGTRGYPIRIDGVQWPPTHCDPRGHHKFSMSLGLPLVRLLRDRPPSRRPHGRAAPARETASSQTRFQWLRDSARTGCQAAASSWAATLTERVTEMPQKSSSCCSCRTDLKFKSPHKNVKINFGTRLTVAMRVLSRGAW